MISEDELTRMAILKAEADKLKAPNQDTFRTTKITEPAEDKKEPKILEGESNIDEFPNKLILGENKTVYFKPWNGKTRKIFKKMASELDDVDIDENSITKLQEILFRDYINTPDMYLSEVEQQYLLIKIRELSLSNNFTFSCVCSECGEANDIVTTIEEGCFYKPSKYPQKNEELDIEFIDIDSNTLFKSEVNRVINDPNWDGITSEGDIEIAMHIKLQNATSCDDVLDEIDKMSLRELNSLTLQLQEAASSLDIKVKVNCVYCDNNVIFTSKSGPDIFEDLL